MGPVFPATYADARERFLQAARSGAGELQSHAHPLEGPRGEPLALDAWREGPRRADRLLIVSSGCHGVEGHAGSAVQHAMLRDGSWRTRAQQAGVALLYLHALNPWGFAHERRVTHENIDLNRNFVDFTQPLPRNEAYARMRPLLVPERWPPSLGNRLALYAFVLRHGMAAVQQAVSGGQYEDPQGLFFGGQSPCWSQQVLRAVLREHGAGAGRIAWVDLHTGLGPRGHGEKILAAPLDAVTRARARAWWGDEVTVPEEGSSSSAVTAGPMWTALHEECPQAEVTGIVLEFGTAPRGRVFDALRADQWLALHPDAPPPARQRVHRMMRDAFLVDTPAWHDAVLRQSRAVLDQALAGLTSPRPE